MAPQAGVHHSLLAVVAPMTGQNPWVLIRKDKPRSDFGSLDGAKKFYDRLRANGGRQPDAAIFGPGGESWYCWGSKEA